MENLDPTEYPDPFFIFVNQASPMTWHNFSLTDGFSSLPRTGSPDDFLTITVDVPAPPPQLRQLATSDCIWEYLIDGRVVRVYR